MQKWQAVPHLHMQLADGGGDMLSQLLLQILQDLVVEGHQLWQRGGDSFGTGDQASQSLQQGSALPASFEWARGAEKRRRPLFATCQLRMRCSWTVRMQRR